MDSKINLKKLTEKDNVESALILGVEGILDFFVMHMTLCKFVKLSPGQIQVIYSFHPDRTLVTVGKSSSLRSTHTQTLSYRDLWIRNSDYHLLDEFEPTDMEDLDNTPYWKEFIRKRNQAVKEYPEWSKGFYKINKTDELSEWLTKKIKLTTREAQVVINFLSEIYEI